MLYIHQVYKKNIHLYMCNIVIFIESLSTCIVSYFDCYKIK